MLLVDGPGVAEASSGGFGAVGRTATNLTPVGAAPWFRVLATGPALCVTLAACGGEEKIPPEPAARLVGNLDVSLHIFRETPHPVA